MIDKPAGLVVHPGAGNPAGTLQNGLLAYLPALAELPRSGILHRLDKDTSGLLLVAKTIPAHTRLVRDLEARQITREYRAVCVGTMTGGGNLIGDAPLLSPLGGSAGWTDANLPQQRQPRTQFSSVVLDGLNALRIEARGSYGNLLHRVPAGTSAAALTWRWRVERWRHRRWRVEHCRHRRCEWWWWFRWRRRGRRQRWFGWVHDAQYARPAHAVLCRCTK